MRRPMTHRAVDRTAEPTTTSWLDYCRIYAHKHDRAPHETDYVKKLKARIRMRGGPKAIARRERDLAWKEWRERRRHEKEVERQNSGDGVSVLRLREKTL